MKVTLHPGAQQDLDKAAAFYEREGSSILATKFVAEFKRLSKLLIIHPEIGAPRSKGRRGFTMSVFPHTIIYRASSTEIRLLVVKHDRKRQGFGGRRV